MEEDDEANGQKGSALCGFDAKALCFDLRWPNAWMNKVCLTKRTYRMDILELNA